MSYALSRHGGFITIDIEAESAVLIEGGRPRVLFNAVP